METFVSSLWAGLKCKIVNVNNVVFMQFLNSLVSSPVWHFANIAYHSSYRIVPFWCCHRCIPVGRSQNVSYYEN